MEEQNKITNFNPHEFWKAEKAKRDLQEKRKSQLESAGAKFSQSGDGQVAVQGASKMAAPQSGAGGDVGNMLVSGGITSGSPEMIAAGAGLKVLSGISQKNKENEINAYNARVDKNQRQRNSIAQLIQVGRSMKL